MLPDQPGMNPNSSPQPTATGPVQIRACQPADSDGIVALLGQLWPGRPFDMEALRRVYDRALASDRQFYFCAVCDQQVVGFGTLDIKSNLWNEGVVGFVDELVVDAAHRGRGIGSRMLDRLSIEARERGCRRLELDSAFHRQEAHAFYEQRGFASRAFLYTKLL